MPDDRNGNTRPPSTTWEFRRVKVRRRPQGPAARRPKDSSFGDLGRLDPKEGTFVKVTYRGGPECWWQLEARGKTVRRPGSLALHDVLWEIFQAD